MTEKRLNEIVDKLVEILCAEQKADMEKLGLDEFTYAEKREIVRVLMVKRLPAPLSSEFMSLQNELLSYESKKRNLHELDELVFKKNMAIYFGDIREIHADAIVNAGNPKLLGSFDGQDNSIDSVIIMAGGLQIRQELNLLMSRQGRPEQRGSAKITKGYNLPSKFVIHTVGPEIVNDNVRYNDKIDLSNCYKACLDMAEEKGLKSIVFPAISTGTYHFPKELASKIAVSTVKEWLEKHKSNILVVFCAFDAETKKFYEENFRNYDIR